MGRAERRPRRRAATRKIQMEATKRIGSASMQPGMKADLQQKPSHRVQTGTFLTPSLKVTKRGKGTHIPGEPQRGERRTVSDS
jgi:hypothetical protein